MAQTRRTAATTADTPRIRTTARGDDPRWDDTRSTAPTARIGSHPIHPMLVPFPIACFVGVLLTDLAYWRTANMMWSDFSSWLISAGVVLGWLAAIAGLVDFASNRNIRSQAPAWPHALGNVLALILATVNMFVHTHDAWTSVVPWGLTLSAAVVLILLVTGWLGWSMVYRHGVGVDLRDIREDRLRDPRVADERLGAAE